MFVTVTLPTGKRAAAQVIRVSCRDVLLGRTEPDGTWATWWIHLLEGSNEGLVLPVDEDLELLRTLAQTKEQGKNACRDWWMAEALDLVLEQRAAAAAGTNPMGLAEQLRKRLAFVAKLPTCRACRAAPATQNVDDDRACDTCVALFPSSNWDELDMAAAIRELGSLGAPPSSDDPPRIPSLSRLRGFTLDNAMLVRAGILGALKDLGEPASAAALGEMLDPFLPDRADPKLAVDLAIPWLLQTRKVEVAIAASVIAERPETYRLPRALG